MAPDPYPVMYPAAYPEVLAISAMDAFGDVAEFSNTGPEVDLYAPGTNVLSAYLYEISRYGIFNGTSSAASHTSGVVALMLGLDRDQTLTPELIREILIYTSDDGNINLVAALEEVLSLQ